MTSDLDESLGVWAARLFVDASEQTVAQALTSPQGWLMDNSQSQIDKGQLSKIEHWLSRIHHRSARCQFPHIRIMNTSVFALN